VIKKQLEAEQKSLTHGIGVLSQQRREWGAAYQQHYQRGREHGARQDPYWIVLVKATFAAMFSLVALGWLIFFISPFLALIPPMIWIEAFLYYRREWQSPGPIQFYELQKVKFAEPTGDKERAEVRPSLLRSDQLTATEKIS